MVILIEKYNNAKDFTKGEILFCSVPGSGGRGVLRYVLGGYVPPRSPNLDSVLE